MNLNPYIYGVSEFVVSMEDESLDLRMSFSECAGLLTPNGHNISLPSLIFASFCGGFSVDI